MSSASTRAGVLTGLPAQAPELAPDAHKGDAGRLLSLCGSRTMPGAAVLVARSAMRAGCGLLRAACLDPEVFQVVPVAVPEAILVDLTAAQTLPAGDDAIVAGPGLGASDRTRAWVARAIDAGAPLLLDADALNVLAGRPERLNARRADTVITPHPGEAARLLGRVIPRDEDGRVECARELAQRSRAVVVLKGMGSVVAEPQSRSHTGGGRVWINTTGNPGMATAGAGDVLTGIAGAYLARAARANRDDWGAFEAACKAVHVHGRAGDLAAERVGVRALIASDLIEALPSAQREPGDGAS